MAGLTGDTLEQHLPMLNVNVELTRRIDTLTFRQIGDLRVDCSGSLIVLRGRCNSYYAKQLASQAVRDLVPGARVTNSIDVTR